MPSLGEIVPDPPRGYRVCAGRLWFPAPPSLVPDEPRTVRRVMWWTCKTYDAAKALSSLFLSVDAPDESESPAADVVERQYALDGRYFDIPPARGGPTLIEELPPRAAEYLDMVGRGIEPRHVRAYLDLRAVDVRSWAAKSAEFGGRLLSLAGRKRVETTDSIGDAA